MKRIVTLSLVPLALAGGLAGIALAGSSTEAEMTDAQEVQARQASGMTLDAAIAAAVKQEGGTALAAGWENNDAGLWGYEVELADASSKVQTWFVNPADGSVTLAAETDDDGEDDAD